MPSKATEHDYYRSHFQSTIHIHSTKRVDESIVQIVQIELHQREDERLATIVG
jgi:hypothetical protein